MPGGSPIPPIFPLICSSTFFTASLDAATIMSCNISRSPATSGSIFTASMFFWPSICTVTMPPPAVASTLISAISCCSFSCIFCACCIIACMLPGNFTSLLLEVSNPAHFPAKDFPEPPHLRVGERAAGGVVCLAGGGQHCGRRFNPRVDRDLSAQRPSEDFAHRFGELLVIEIQLVGFRRDHLQFGACDGDARVFHGVSQMRKTLFREVGMKLLLRLPRTLRSRWSHWRRWSRWRPAAGWPCRPRRRPAV